MEEEVKSLLEKKLSSARKNSVAGNALFSRMATLQGMDVKSVTNNDPIVEERKPPTASFMQSRFTRR